MARAVFSEDNLETLFRFRKVSTDGITFVLDGSIGDKQVNVSVSDLTRMIHGGVVTTFDSNGLKVEYILSDIGWDRIFRLMKKYNMI